MSELSIALNRFGLGARSGEPHPRDGRRWLLQQLDRFEARPPAIAATPSSAVVAGQLLRYRVAPPMTEVVLPPGVTAARAARLASLKEQRAQLAIGIGARANAALATPAPFIERLVHFWANHFAVSADKLSTYGLAGTLEFEAVRPHVLGRFGDMLAAVERHPAMLIYLDQVSAIGPNSETGRGVAARGITLGLNENLAREILELHTLGVAGGYSQADVTELARAMTGWTAAGVGSGRINSMMREVAPGTFAFIPALHEPGDRVVLGRRYPAAGVGQADAILATLAIHPATARHIATKLARHFAGDAPPPALVSRLVAAFLNSGGDLPTVYRALIAAPEPWVAAPVKFKTPWEWTVSSLRAVNAGEVPAEAVVGLAEQLGQPIWQPGQPAGYDDTAANWAGPDAVMRRVEAAEQLAGRARTPLDARALGLALFPGALSPTTATALDRAESPGQALALLLVAPESLRR